MFTPLEIGKLFDDIVVRDMTNTCSHVLLRIPCPLLSSLLCDNCSQNVSEKKKNFSDFKLLAKDTLSPFTCMNNWTNPPSPFSVLKHTVPVVQRDERVARKKQAFH